MYTYMYTIFVNCPNIYIHLKQQIVTNLSLILMKESFSGTLFHLLQLLNILFHGL